MPKPSLVWFRHDLRLADNPALAAAVRHGGPVIPVFVWAPDEEGGWPAGGASRWWLQRALGALARDLAARGSRLILRTGASLAQLQELARTTGAEAVFWNRRYEPAIIARDTRVKETLHRAGLRAESFNGALLHEPWTIRNQADKPFQVFTPFWRHALAQTQPSTPLPAPDRLAAPASWPDGVQLDALGLEPRIPWAGGLAAAWTPGEAGAAALLDHFCAGPVADYTAERNRPDRIGTSRLSPHLHFGEVSPRQIWQALEARGPAGWRQSQFVAELFWREFSHHLLFHFPHTPDQPLRPTWNAFPWRDSAPELAAWQRGRTGFPIVDAGMRELWATGWMHNRVRMITASFLVKDLRISWTAGARWFWDTLVDADLAQNTQGWQWTAGCGADAAPYFRVFNPRSQGEKFDPTGDYVRRWVPELARLPAEHIHAPADAPAAVLAAAGVTPGRSYPRPIVDHAAARTAALAAYAALRAAPEAGGVP